jgi:hypothetical protein
MSERLNKLIEDLKNKKELEKTSLLEKKKKKESIRRKKLYQKNKKKKEKLMLKKGVDRKIPNSWRIIISSRKKKLVELTYASNREDAMKKFQKLLVENKEKVRFEVKYVQLDNEMVESNYELLLLRKRSDLEKSESFVRNDYGQLIPHKTNDDKWVIAKKSKYLLEENFWLYGFHPTYERKDFNYILNNVLLTNGKTNNTIKRVMVFYNKLIIEKDDDFDIVICKNQNDCVRLYNELEKECLGKKIKTIMFFGFVRDSNKTNIIEKIMVKTGWDKRKITRKSTKP